MKISLPLRPKARIEMLPLIDIVFLLLVVFIYAMLSMAVHQGMPVDLPDSTEARSEKNLTLSVSIQSAGDNVKIFINEEQVTLAEIGEVLAVRARQLKQAGQEPGVLLFADKDVAYQKIFNVLDRINQAGLSRISLQADVEQ